MNLEMSRGAFRSTCPNGKASPVLHDGNAEERALGVVLRDNSFRSMREVPSGMATSESWRLQGRNVIPRSRPVAIFRPDDFVPEHFGCQEGIPLYRREQTTQFTPQPHTVAAQHYYDV